MTSNSGDDDRFSNVEAEAHTRQTKVPPLTVTTRTHGMALSIYALVLVLGWAHITDSITHQSMDDWFGSAVTFTWATWHFPAGGLAIIGAVYASVSRNPVIGMWVEAVGCTITVVIMTMYLRALDQFQSQLGVTQFLAAFVTIGALASLVQILYEQFKIWRSDRAGVLTTSSTLADPTKTTGRGADD